MYQHRTKRTMLIGDMVLFVQCHYIYLHNTALCLTHWCYMPMYCCSPNFLRIYLNFQHLNYHISLQLFNMWLFLCLLAPTNASPVHRILSQKGRRTFLFVTAAFINGNREGTIVLFPLIFLNY